MLMVPITAPVVLSCYRGDDAAGAAMGGVVDVASIGSQDWWWFWGKVNQRWFGSDRRWIGLELGGCSYGTVGGKVGA